MNFLEEERVTYGYGATVHLSGAQIIVYTLHSLFFGVKYKLGSVNTPCTYAQ